MRQALPRDRADHRRDPALHQRQRGLQPGQRGLLGGRVLRPEQPLAGQRLAQRLGVGDVDVGNGLLQPRHVDGDTAGILLDRAEQMRAQPRHVREQPLVRGLAQGEEEPDLADVDGQAPAELRHPRGQQRGRTLRAERQPDVGRADHLAGELAHRGPGLAADHRAAQLAHHRPEPAQAAGAAEGTERLPYLVGHVLAELGGIGGEHPAHRLDALGRDRVAQLRPDREGRLQPLRPAPGLDLADARGELRGLVQP